MTGRWGPRPVRLLVLHLLVLAACAEDRSPTAPAEPGGLAHDHTAGHKVVNSVADPGNGICNAAQCTLREAIGDPGSTEISFAPGLAGPITLVPPAAGGGPLAITHKLSITGPPARMLIRRRSTDPEFRIIEVVNSDVGCSVTLNNLIIRGGNAGFDDPGGAQGGGIFVGVFDTLRIMNSVIAGNSAGSTGGGIRSFGALTLNNSTISRNSAGVNGGGIASPFGSLTITNSRVSGNVAPEIGGGGIYTEVPLRLSNTTVSDNRSARGAGIFAGFITLDISRSTISGNSATESGGGIFTFGTTTLTNSTVSGNSAPAGGGIANPGTLAVSNSTIAGNTATEGSGGGGITSGGSLLLVNTLVALNTAHPGPDVLKESGGTVTARFSLLGIGNGSGVRDGLNGNQAGTRLDPLHPRLGPLADNGGTTFTRALQPGSPAIDAASTPDCPAIDQRGVLRPQGQACDIGSYERQ